MNTLESCIKKRYKLKTTPEARALRVKAYMETEKGMEAWYENTHKRKYTEKAALWAAIMTVTKVRKPETIQKIEDAYHKLAN